MSKKSNEDISKKSVVVKKKIIIQKQPLPFLQAINGYFDLPMDVISEIFKYLYYEDSITLALVCKRFYKSYIPIVDKERVFTTKVKSKEGVTLETCQYIACKKLEIALKNHKQVCFNAPLGYGKTLTALFFAFRVFTHKNILISVPSHILKVWITELDKLGLYNSDPSKSEILIIQSTRSNHYTEFKLSRDLGNLFNVCRVIITTLLISSKLEGKCDLQIVDEGHKELIKNLSGTRMLYLTAEKMNIHTVKSGVFLDGLPEVEYTWSTIKNNSVSKGNYKDNIEDMFVNQAEYNALIIKAVSKHKKACLMMDGGHMGYIIRDMLKANFPDSNFFELKSSENVLKKHANSTKHSILIIPLSNCEGINIFFDNLIIIKPNLLSSYRLGQAISRVRRPPNPNKHIEITFVLGGRVAELKTLYGLVYASVLWKNDVAAVEQSPSVDALFKSESIAKLLGYDDLKVQENFVDMAVIFDMVKGQERCDQVYEWWLQNKKDETKLSKSRFKKLYL